MRIVLERADFRRLSPDAQKEILTMFSGRDLVDRSIPSKRSAHTWRRPYDLDSDLARQVLHNLPEDHRRRLELFARRDGRVQLSELLSLTGDRDWHALSSFQALLTRKLRRFIDDPEKKAQLIHWDFDSTKWDPTHGEIIDGVYFVSETTAQTLKDHFGV